MEPSLATARPWLATALMVAAVIAILGAAAGLVGSIAEIDRLQGPRLRTACTLVSGALVATSFLGWPGPLSLTLSCVGFLLGLQAIAIEFARQPTLRDYLARRRNGDDPGWWREFESAFWLAVSTRRRQDESAGDPRRSASTDDSREL